MTAIVTNPSWWAVFVAGISLCISCLMMYGAYRSSRSSIDTVTSLEIDHLKQSVDRLAEKNELAFLGKTIEGMAKENEVARRDRQRIFRKLDSLNSKVAWLQAKMNGGEPPKDPVEEEEV